MRISAGDRRRHRRRRRSRRRLIAVVIAVDIAGGGALAYALTRPAATHQTRSTSATAAAMVAHPQNPLTQPASLPDRTPPTPSRTQHPVRRHRRAASHPASSMGRAQASFGAVAGQLPGQSGVAVGSLGAGPVSTYGNLQVAHGWSTMKVPVLTTLLADLDTHGQRLDAAQAQDATLAVEQSDNAAAQALFGALETAHGGLDGASQAVEQTLARAGEQVTVNTAPNNGGYTTWGQTEWSASDEVIFYRSLARGCLLPAGDTQYVLGLMSNVETAQRWGAGSVDFGAPVAFKAGWGPDSDHGGGYLVRQTAIVGAGDHGYVLSMIAAPSDGSFGTGIGMLDRIAAWAAVTFDASTPVSPAGCG